MLVSQRKTDNIWYVGKFNCGQKIGKKSDPVQVATDMRKAKNQAGNRLFTRDERLNATQVKGFFSRFSKHLKGKLATLDSAACAIEINVMVEEDDEEEKVEREILITEIENQIKVTHPIFMTLLTYTKCTTRTCCHRSRSPCLKKFVRTLTLR